MVDEPFFLGESTPSQLTSFFQPTPPKDLIINKLALNLSSFQEPLHLPQIIIQDHFKDTNSISAVSNSIFPTDSKEENKELILHKTTFLSWLRTNGYPELSTQLENESGYPWNHFIMVRSPTLIEQLITIHTLCEEKFSADRTKKEECLRFALNLSYMVNAFILNKEEFEKIAAIHEAKTLLAKFIFLIDKNPQEAFNTTFLSHKKATQKIQSFFDFYMEEIKNELNNHRNAHLKTGLQSPDIAFQTLIPLVIAKTLISSTGKMNFGLIDILLNLFLSNHEHINYEANLVHALTLLQHSPSLRANFESIKRPGPANKISESIIRTSLNLSPAIEINDCHTRMTALTACLSHLRQGNESSCFATSLAIEILSSHLQLCFKDLRQILEKGKLKRSVNDVITEISFINRINDDNLHQPILFNTKGSIFINKKKQGALWDSPGLQSACQAVGLTNTKDIFQRLLSTIPIDKKKVLYTKTPYELLSALNHQHQMDDTQFAAMCFAFSSQTAQPLLKTWENAIAGMAEAEEGSLIKTKNIQSALEALQYHLGKLNIQPSPLIEKLLIELAKKIRKDIYFQYDPAVSGSTKPDKGGFILYAYEERIDTPKLYCLFIRKILREVFEKITITETIDQTSEFLQVHSILDAYIQSDRFIAYLLGRYHDVNKTIISQLNHGEKIPFESLDYTPWITKFGNDSKLVLKIYFGSNSPITIKEFIHSNAKEALFNVIEMCKEMPIDEKKYLIKNPHKLKPFCILGKHRLPFMPGHPSLVKSWDTEISTAEWINSNVIEPGEFISRSQITKKSKEMICKRLKEEILLNYLPPSQIILSLNQIDTLSSKQSIKDFRRSILEILENQRIDQKSLEKLRLQLDTLIYESIDPLLQKKLENSAIHFADTNWNHGVQDIHFCFMINPGNGQMELWEVDANGTHLKAMKQSYWLIDQKWQFPIIPKELALDDQEVFPTIDSDSSFS